LVRITIHNLFMLLLLATGPVLAETTDTALGREIYADYCQNCHGEDKSGLADYNDSLDNFRQRIEGVTENMPDFAGFFDDDEIVSLHAYLMEAGE